jgi:type III pantothenate kinase
VNKPPPVDAVLAIDVGNTRIGMAVSDLDGMHSSRRIAADDVRAVRAALDETWKEARGTRAVAIGSVSPANLARVTPLIQEVCDQTGWQVRDDLPLPMELDIENTREVGVDRVCAAAAAYERLKTSCAVASFGTATTVDCVSAEGTFLGGAILPGFEMSYSALHTGTALLPQVGVERPQSAFGKNTHDAIVNGVTYGLVGALREIVERFAIELGSWPQLVITGGNAGVIQPLADYIDAVVPDLTLIGIALAYRRATEGQ